MAHRTRRELDGRFTAVLGRQVSVRQHRATRFIESDNGRDMSADYLCESGFTVRTADSTDDGMRRATKGDVIATGFRGSLRVMAWHSVGVQHERRGR
jgi:hypothetical protein